MTENDDLKKEPNRETEAALEAVANQDVARFTNVGSLLADLNDELIKQTTNAMAREFEKGEEIERLLDRVSYLEGKLEGYAIALAALRAGGSHD